MMMISKKNRSLIENHNQ